MSKELLAEDPMPDNRKEGKPSAPVPTTKTGILSVMKDWGVSTAHINKAKNMEYSDLKKLIGNSTRETAAAVFNAALGNAENVKDTEQMDKKSSGLKEEIAGLFSGQELTEEFKAKAELIFEAAVDEKVAAKVAAIEEEAAEEIAERITALEEEMTENVDRYLSYVAEQWLEENQLAVENGLRTEIAESFMEGLGELLRDHHIDIPAEKVDIFDTMAEELTEATEENEALLNRVIKLEETLDVVKKELILESVAAGMTLTDVERLRTLSESVEAENDEEYEAKLVSLKESFFRETLVEADEKKTVTPGKKEVISESKVDEHTKRLVEAALSSAKRPFSVDSDKAKTEK